MLLEFQLHSHPRLGYVIPMDEMFQPRHLSKLPAHHRFHTTQTWCSHILHGPVIHVLTMLVSRLVRLNLLIDLTHTKLVVFHTRSFRHLTTIHIRRSASLQVPGIASIAARPSGNNRHSLLTRNMSTPADHKPLKQPSKTPAVPRPSSRCALPMFSSLNRPHFNMFESVLLISPTNQILLLHRVRQASSFASAHVFPGGALSPEHDGSIPSIDSPQRHADGPAYRMAAIRETFEECGILLAKDKRTGKLFMDVSDKEREEGRKAVHGGKVAFCDLLEKWGAEPDTDSLLPFTRWITPPNVPKRFSTQMYIYFLPLGSTSPTKHAAQTSTSTPISTQSLSGLEEDEIVIPNPTHDGGIEHTAARFLPPNKWIDLARQNRIILFPPQFFLTLMLAPYLAPGVTSPSSPIPSLQELQLERERLLDFLKKPRMYEGEPEPSWQDACISPLVLGKGQYGEKNQDGVGGVDKHTAVLVLDSPGKEVTGRRGIREWVVTTKFKKDGPRDVDVKRREDVLLKSAGAKL